MVFYDYSTYLFNEFKISLPNNLKTNMYQLTLKNVLEYVYKVSFNFNITIDKIDYIRTVDYNYDKYTVKCNLVNGKTISISYINNITIKNNDLINNVASYLLEYNTVNNNNKTSNFYKLDKFNFYYIKILNKITKILNYEIIKTNTEVIIKDILNEIKNAILRLHNLIIDIRTNYKKLITNNSFINLNLNEKLQIDIYKDNNIDVKIKSDINENGNYINILHL